MTVHSGLVSSVNVHILEMWQILCTSCPVCLTVLWVRCGGVWCILSPLHTGHFEELLSSIEKSWELGSHVFLCEGWALQFEINTWLINRFLFHKMQSSLCFTGQQEPKAEWMSAGAAQLSCWAGPSWELLKLAGERMLRFQLHHISTT